MKTSDGRLTRALRDRSRTLALLALAVGAQAGCGREFFREWANQDVSEAVFEKSRDPRWRLDMFSVEPPALSRFADPYDPDRPPAPPDDHATEALSTVPQWPDNRLIIPAEGTGYLDQLDGWQRDHPARSNPAVKETVKDAPATPYPAPATPAPPDPGLPSPFLGRPPTGGDAAKPGVSAIPGTDVGALSPIPLPKPRSTAESALKKARDLGVMLAAFQETGLPMPVPTPAPNNAPPREPSSDITPPPIGMDPQPNDPNDLSKPIIPPPDQTPNQYRASEAVASELAGILVPGAIDFNEAEAVGLPRNATPYVLTMEQAFTLALINSRVYQFQLEQVYIGSLALTLQRFAFTPQFYAGLTPNSATVAGGGVPSPNPVNQFLYQTRATGAPISALNMGTVAGVGKAFSTGGRIVAGFANQVVFNFIGKNSFQPKVQSYLPISILQPFLRGGGRAVTLEALTQAERSLLYTIRAFAKFRQEFLVQTLIGGQIVQFGTNVLSVGFSGVQSTDPNIGFINVVEDVQLLENAKRNIAALEQILKVYMELVKGEPSGISQLQVDQIDQSLQFAKLNFIQARQQYRYDSDQYRQQIGLPPDTPIVPDRSLTRQFRDVFADIDDWQANPRRDLETLPIFAKRLPQLQDIIVDGRSVLGVYKDGKNNEDDLDDLMITVERTAMDRRLDLMNQRAILYDIWRQIKFTANALQGVLNVGITNQFLTPPTTNNPFGFVDQAKQFSLVINAELPLVRLAERNNFRSALIGYQRQRRSLQNTEDSIKTTVRQDVRLCQTAYLTYEIARRNLVLAVRLKDQAFEQIVAPPAAGGASQAPLQTTNLIQFQNSLLNVENQLVSTWYNYQINRLQLYRDMGTLPFDEWEAFHELFPAEPLERVSGGAVVNEGPPGIGAARAEAEPAPVGR